MPTQLGQVTDGYTLVFDLQAIDFRFHGETLLFICLLIALPTLSFFIFRWLKTRKVKLQIHIAIKIAVAVLSLFLIIIFLFVGMVLYSSESEDYDRHQRMNEGCKMISGKIQNFEPLLWEYKREDHFIMVGPELQKDDPKYPKVHHFAVHYPHMYYNPPAGLLQEGDTVRICALFSREVDSIIRLEIKNYQGKVKDYSRDSSQHWFIDELKKTYLWP